ncbi:MAG: hypothetical protein FJ145_15610 [Deltaproteobacteria bacterium]|nr:hypothetical protein [Deltaproteobacteria bacterium]
MVEANMLEFQTHNQALLDFNNQMIQKNAAELAYLRCDVDCGALFTEFSNLPAPQMPSAGFGAGVGGGSSFHGTALYTAYALEYGSGVPSARTQEFIRGVQSGNIPVTSSAGAVAKTAGHHQANVTLRNAEGRVIHRGRVVSGNMTDEEKALGFPKNTLASHTEARAIRNTPLRPGESLTITGQKPPCPVCKGTMNKAAKESGAVIRYQWREGGQTHRWYAGE